MVAENQMYISPAGFGLILQPVEKPQHLSHVESTVKNISQNDQMPLSKNPVEVIIDYIVLLQQIDQRIEIALNIRHQKELFPIGIHTGRFANRLFELNPETAWEETGFINGNFLQPLLPDPLRAQHHLPVVFHSPQNKYAFVFIDNVRTVKQVGFLGSLTRIMNLRNGMGLDDHR